MSKRMYIDRGVYFEVFEDGTVKLISWGKEVAKKKLEKTHKTAIMNAFAVELAKFAGMGVETIPPQSEIEELREDVKKLTKEVRALKKLGK